MMVPVSPAMPSLARLKRVMRALRPGLDSAKAMAAAFPRLLRRRDRWNLGPTVESCCRSFSERLRPGRRRYIWCLDHRKIHRNHQGHSKRDHRWKNRNRWSCRSGNKGCNPKYYHNSYKRIRCHYSRNISKHHQPDHSGHIQTVYYTAAITI